MTILKDRISKHQFESMIKPLKPNGELREGLLHILVSNRFQGERVKKNLGQLIEAALSQTAQTPVTVSFSVNSDAPAPATAKTDALEEEATEKPKKNKKKKKRKAAASDQSGLNGQYVFDSFVVGASNQFVAAAAERVADAPADAYNPLFIYGGVGLGKTHIMHAIGNRVVEMRPDLKVLYLSSEKFMTQLINSLRFKRVFDFKENFRSVDVLLVDDIQFIAGKERTQEEFFHTFNALFESKKQIVISSDSFPQDIKDLEERLRSRFGWGLVADIQPPDLETRIAILNKKAAREGHELPDDVAFFLANLVRTNIRELEGALIRVSAYAGLTRKPITVNLAKGVLKDLVGGMDKPILIEAIQKTVAAYYGINPKEMVSKNRSRRVSRPRQVAMYLAKSMTSSSLPEIGQKFGGRDHTTVLYAVRKVNESRRNDPTLDEELESLKTMLNK